MPTLNKLEYLDETKELIKNALNTKFNSGITDEDTFRSYVGKIQNIYTNWPKVTDKGTELSITAKKGKMVLAPKGNTEQDGEPTPDVPVDVKVVTGDNTIKVEGKNLFDKNNVRDGYRIIQDGYYADAGYSATEIINVKPNTTYSTSWTIFWGACVCTYDKNDNFSRRIQAGTSFTTTSTEYYIRACVENNMLSTAQIEIGSSSSSYQPYQSQTYPLNLGSIELCKIGDYQDYIYKDNGKWYKHSEIGKVVLDGSESWLLRSDVSQKYNYYSFRNDDYVEGAFSTNSNGYSNYFKIVTSITINENSIRFVNATGYGTQICISGDIAQTVEALKLWLNNHNVTVYYVLATPTDEEITDTTLISQLEALNNAMAFDGTNNISSEYATGNAPVIISASALMKGGN
jgi:hypothetical protein